MDFLRVYPAHLFGNPFLPEVPGTRQSPGTWGYRSIAQHGAIEQPDKLGFDTFLPLPASNNWGDDSGVEFWYWTLVRCGT